MKPPKPFKFDPKRGYSPCDACGKWRQSNAVFHHEGRHWILCQSDFEDYWFNTEVLMPDYKGYV